MSWELTIRLRGPVHVLVEVDPLPSRLAQVVVLVQPSRSPSARRRLERLFQRVVVDRTTGRRTWAPVPSCRDVAWRAVVTTRGEWWICGPLAHAGDTFAQVMSQLGGRCVAARIRRRALLIVDARTGAELGPEVPASVRVHMPDLGADDDARAA